MKARTKTGLICLLVIVLIGCCIQFDRIEREKQLFDKYTQNTKQQWTCFYQKADKLNNGVAVDYRDFTGTYIAFVAASSDWNELYYELKEYNRLPQANCDLDYTSNDFVGEVKELYYDFVELYYLQLDYDSTEKDEIQYRIDNAQQKMNSFETFSES